MFTTYNFIASKLIVEFNDIVLFLRNFYCTINDTFTHKIYIYIFYNFVLLKFDKPYFSSLFFRKIKFSLLIRIHIHIQRRNLIKKLNKLFYHFSLFSCLFNNFNLLYLFCSFQVKVPAFLVIFLNFFFLLQHCSTVGS